MNTDANFAARLLGAAKPANPAINELRVLHLLRTRGALSRADIARHTNLTKATASRLIAELENHNLVREVGPRTQRRGRRPILYEFNTASAVALGVEVRQNECQAVVTELDATPLRSYVEPLPDHQVGTFIQVLSQIVEQVRADFPQHLVGIGIGIPGIYDYQQRVVILAERMEWVNLDLVRQIRERLSLDVYVVNRANAAALGEKWYGAGRGREDLIFLHIGSGIKAGLIVDGELYWGSNGSAGEIGHMTLAADGPVCVCGKRGCLEALASTQAILERLKALARAGRADTLVARLDHSIETLTRPEVLLAAHAGDPTVLEVLHEAATYIGIGVANLINFFNPERVILGGVVAQTPAIFLDTIKAVAARHAFEIPWRATEIVAAELGQEAVAIGAAALLLSGYLQPSRAVLSAALFETQPAVGG